MRFVLLFLTVLKRFEIRIEKRNERAAHEVSSENCMFQKQILELKQANVKLQNEIHELEQYGRRSFLRIDGIPDVSNESSEDVFNDIADIFVIAGTEDVVQYIDRAHRIGKSYHQKIKKSARA